MIEKSVVIIVSSVCILIAVILYIIVFINIIDTFDTRLEMLLPQVKKSSIYSFIGTVLLIIVLTIFYTEYTQLKKYIIILVISSIALCLVYSSIVLSTQII